jgi:N-acetyl-anhydromuramyl-L-alanine amidase AmpD
MLTIDHYGRVHSNRIKLAICQTIQKNPLLSIRGIVVHQTNGPTAQAAFNSYKRGINGAHFLIDKDGTIYQTASVKYQTWHVGQLRARCLATLTCSKADAKLFSKWNVDAYHRREMAKSIPDRYPSNKDSIGIELVGQAFPLDINVKEEDRIYETVTQQQNASLKWLIRELRVTMGVPLTEIFRHPDISYKNMTEAKTANWE